MWWILVKIDFDGTMLAAETLKFYLKNNSMCWQLQDMLINAMCLLMFEIDFWFEKAINIFTKERSEALLTVSYPGLELFSILLDYTWSRYSLDHLLSILLLLFYLHVHFFFIPKLLFSHCRQISESVKKYRVKRKHLKFHH